VDTPPALPEKKRRSAASQTTDSSGCRVSYERHPSQYDNISEDDLQNPASGPSVPFTPFAAILPFQQGGSSASVEFVGDFAVPESTGDPEKPPPLPEKKNKHMLAYMQLLEDYSEPQPSMFYQTPQNEHIYQQKNKMLMEVYGFNDSFSTEASQELAPPPALPPKQRQLASYAASSFSVSYCVQQTKVAFTPEDGSAAQGISVSVSNSFLSRHGNLPVPSYKSVFRSYSQDFVPHNQASVQPFLPPTSSSSPHFPPVHQSQSSDLAVPAVASLPPSTVDGPLSSSQESNFHGNTVRLPSEISLTDSPQTPSESPAMKDGHPRDPSSASSAAGKESRDGDRASRSPDGSELARSEEEVDELSLIDHNEIMARLTLKQEGDDGPDVRGGSGDILLVHATETDRKDLVLGII